MNFNKRNIFLGDGHGWIPLKPKNRLQKKIHIYTHRKKCLKKYMDFQVYS